ncbi:MAG: nucleotide sugar dehydrogenase [Candidatus Aminicenantes bacterium]|nr:nucleotide sugar dehydrogenase [Candidatus Aminicenantes bacterium]
MKFEKNILCIGAGYVGGPTMAVIALKCPTYRVEVVDIDQDRIDRWNSDKIPIFEPGLDKIVKETRGRNLFFSTRIEKGIKAADIIFVSVNTPTKTFGEGAGMASDLQHWEKTAHKIIESADSDKIIVEKSTLPVRTAEAMERILKAGNRDIKYEVLSNPEFLAEGTAVKDLLEPDRVLIGSHQTEEGKKAAAALVKIYAHWVPKENIITANLWSAELSKLVANAFLAQRISSINAISALCEKTDADVAEISFAVGRDSRIGEKFLRPSIGFGGSCFKKDILNLVYIARGYSLNEVADYWEMVVKMNEYQKSRFVQRIVREMFNTVAGKKIALFGFAFKANTGDTRESPAIFVTQKLVEERAFVTVTDPEALDNARKDLESTMQMAPDLICFEPDPYKAAEDAHAVALLTEWEEYRQLDFEKIYKSMKKPAFIFDGRNILDHKKLYETGFNVYPIGKMQYTHFD